MAKELLKLRMKHGLSLNDVADICGFDVVYVARMELGVPVTVYYAHRLRRRLAAHLDVALTEAVLPVVLIGDEGGSNIQIGMRECGPLPAPAQAYPVNHRPTLLSSQV